MLVDCVQTTSAIEIIEQEQFVCQSTIQTAEIIRALHLILILMESTIKTQVQIMKNLAMVL